MSPRVPVSGPLPPVEVIVDRIGRLEDRLDLRSDGRTRLLPVTKAFPVEAVAAVPADEGAPDLPASQDPSPEGRSPDDTASGDPA